MNGTTTDVRVLDDNFKPLFGFLRNRWPRLHASHITLIRILLLPIFPVFMLCGEPLLPLLCFLDGLTDMADGAWARLFKQESPLGQFFDQAADKVSNWFRTWILYTLATPLICLDTTVFGGYSLFWSSLAVAFALDAFNFCLRVYYLATGKKGNGSPVLYGKIKTWCQGYGITSFVIVMVVTRATTPAEQTSSYLGLFYAWIGIAWIIPARTGFRRWNDWVWYALTIGNFVLGFAACSGVTRIFTEIIGEIGFYASVVFSILSTFSQLVAFFRSKRAA